MDSSLLGFDSRRNTSDTALTQSVASHPADGIMQASHRFASEAYASTSITSMVPLNRTASDANSPGDMSPLRRIINGAVELLPGEMSEKTQATVVDRTAMLLKTGALYYHTSGGRMAYVALSALDEPVKGRGTFTAMGIGALKGAMTYGISSSISGSMMSPVVKGAMISLSSQIIDIGLSNETYKDHYGNFDLGKGLGRIGSTVLSPSNLAATAGVALVTNGAFYGMNRFSGNFMKQSPFVNSLVTASVMGGTTGSTLEYFRQRQSGEEFNLGKIAKAGAVEALFSGTAAIPGAVRSDPVLREKLSEALFHSKDLDRRPMLYYPEGKKEPITIRIEKESPLNKLYEKAQESVVKISTITGSGTGFFVSKDGELVTNAHVVGDSPYVKVTTTQGYKYRAKVVEIDALNDYAILKVVNPDRAFKPLPLDPATRPGESIIVAGFARGGDRLKISTGVIEGVEKVPTVVKMPMTREHTGENYLLPHEFDKKFGTNIGALQGKPIKVGGDNYKEMWTSMVDGTNTALPGHSGSPIINRNGHVVGIVSRGSVDDVAGVRPQLVMQGLEKLHPNPVFSRKGSTSVPVTR